MRLLRIAKRRPGLAIATGSAMAILAGAGLAVWFGTTLTTLIVVLVLFMFVHDLYLLVVEWVDAWQYEGLISAYVKASRTGKAMVVDTHEVWPVPHDMEEPVSMHEGENPADCPACQYLDAVRRGERG